MDILFVLGHVGYTLIALGMYMLGHGNPKGFLVQGGGSFALMLAGMYSEDAKFLIPWNILFVLISTLGYWRLRKNAKLQQVQE